MATPKSSVDGALLNVDLEVRSRTNLGSLIQALGDRVVVLHHAKTGSSYLLSLELADQRPRNADAIIRRLAALVTDLPPAAAQAWRGSRSRVFDIGIQAGTKANPHHTALARATLESVAQLQASIVITTYAPGGTPPD